MHPNVYLDTIAKRLLQAGYGVRRDPDMTAAIPKVAQILLDLGDAYLPKATGLDNWQIDLIAQKPEQESWYLEKMDVVFLITQHRVLSIDDLQHYLLHSFGMSQLTKTVGMPQVVFAVSLVADPDDEAVIDTEWRDYADFGNRLGKILPVIVDTRFHQIHYFHHIPLVSSAAHERYRKLLRKYLQP